MKKVYMYVHSVCVAREIPLNLNVWSWKSMRKIEGGVGGRRVEGWRRAGENSCCDQINSWTCGEYRVSRLSCRQKPLSDRTRTHTSKGDGQNTLSNTDVQKALYADKQTLYLLCNQQAQMLHLLSSKPSWHHLETPHTHTYAHTLSCKEEGEAVCWRLYSRWKIHILFSVRTTWRHNRVLGNVTAPQGCLGWITAIPASVALSASGACGSIVSVSKNNTRGITVPKITLHQRWTNSTFALSSQLG